MHQPPCNLITLDSSTSCSFSCTHSLTIHLEVSIINHLRNLLNIAIDEPIDIMKPLRSQTKFNLRKVFGYSFVSLSFLIMLLISVSQITNAIKEKKNDGQPLTEDDTSLGQLMVSLIVTKLYLFKFHHEHPLMFSNREYCVQTIYLCSLCFSQFPCSSCQYCTCLCTTYSSVRSQSQTTLKM